MNTITHDTKYVGKYTRAGIDGKNIICPLCDKTTTVYHFSWSALVCTGCYSTVEKSAWQIKSTKPTAKKLRTVIYVRETLQKFVDGELEKFDAYGLVFDQLDARRITLTKICTIAESVGIKGDVIIMRRWQFLGMR